MGGELDRAVAFPVTIPIRWEGESDRTWGKGCFILRRWGVKEGMPNGIYD